MDFGAFLNGTGNISDTSAARFRVEYEPPQFMVQYQKSMARLGHEGNITRVLDELSQPVIEEYFVGLVVLGVILLVFFVLWSILLLVLKFTRCCDRGGSQRVGFLSGAQFVREEKPNTNLDDSKQRKPDDDEVATNDTEYLDRMMYEAGDALGSRPTTMRFIFLFSGLTSIVFGCLMATQGITNLETSFVTLDGRANDLLVLVETANEILTDGLLVLTERATIIRDVLNNELSDAEFCPAHPGLFDSMSGFTKQIMDSKNQVMEVLDLLADFQDGDLKNIQAAITMIYNATQDVTEETDNYSVSGWESLIVLIPYTIFPSLLMMGVIFSMFDISWNLYDIFLHWIVLPIFIAMTVVAYVFASLMTVLAGVNSDFCLPGGYEDTSSSPDDLFLSTLSMFGYSPETWGYRVANFYISQCRADDPFAGIRQYESILEKSFSQVAGLNQISLNSDAMAELGAFCNRDYDALSPLLEAMNDIIEILAVTVAQALDLAQCGRIIPLYTDTVYEAGCVYTPKAIFWIFICCLILGFFGMVMITLRSALRPTVVLASEEQVEHLAKADPSRDYDCSVLDDKFFDAIGSNDDQSTRQSIMAAASRPKRNVVEPEAEDDSVFARAQEDKWRKYVGSKSP